MSDTVTVEIDVETIHGIVRDELTSSLDYHKSQLLAIERGEFVALYDTDPIADAAKIRKMIKSIKRVREMFKYPDWR